MFGLGEDIEDERNGGVKMSSNDDFSIIWKGHFGRWRKTRHGGIVVNATRSGEKSEQEERAANAEDGDPKYPDFPQ